MERSLQSTAELEPETVWPQWRGRGTQLWNGRGRMQLIFILSSKLTLGTETKIWGPLKGLHTRMGGGRRPQISYQVWKTLRASCLVVVIRNDVIAFSFTLWTSSAGAADLGQNSQGYTPLFQLSIEGPRIIGDGLDIEEVKQGQPLPKMKGADPERFRPGSLKERKSSHHLRASKLIYCN